MTHDLVYEKLRRLGGRNPNYQPPDNRPTYLVIEVAEGDDSVHFASTIVDPEMPNDGNAECYLKLQSMQRVALELAHISHIIIDALAGVAIHGPESEELQKYDLNDRVQALRFLSQKGAIMSLNISTETGGHA